MRRGFTYAEVIISLAVFCIAMVPVFPALSLASRNAEAVGEGYRASVAAQEILLILKGAAENGDAPLPLVQAYASGLIPPLNAFAFAVDGLGISYTPPGASFVSWLNGLPECESYPGYLISVAVFNSEGVPIGRAACIVHPK